MSRRRSRRTLAGLAANVIAQSAVPLNGQRGAVEPGTETITTPGVRTSETNLGDLTADLMLWQAQQNASAFGVDSPQVGLQNGGGIRNSSVIPAGPITELNTFEILAFTTNFVSVKEDISATTFKELLETSVSEIGNGRFGQRSGVTFTYDPDQPRRTINPDTCAVSTPCARPGRHCRRGPDFRQRHVRRPGRLDGRHRHQRLHVPGRGLLRLRARRWRLHHGGRARPAGARGAHLEAPVAQGGLGGQITAADYPVGGEGRIVAI